jgi:hypothetical protein
MTGRKQNLVRDSRFKIKSAFQAGYKIPDAWNALKIISRAYFGGF